MGADDRIKNTAQDVAGSAKETAGDVTGNDELKAEGLIDQGKAAAKNFGEDVKDKVNDIKDSLKSD